jgi:hypothetical protein
MTLDDLIAGAPSTAHRQLLLLFQQFVESGGTVKVEGSDTAALLDRVAALEQKVEQMIAVLLEHEQDIKQLGWKWSEHSHNAKTILEKVA